MSKESPSDHPDSVPQPEDKRLGDPGAPTAPSPVRKKRSRRAVVVSIVLASAAATAVLYSWHLPPFTSAIERTDNAYVRGLVTVVSPQVAGYVTKVFVKDFEQVSAGENLFQIDDRIYGQRVEQAKATLAARAAELANLDQTIASRSATVSAREAGIVSAKAELTRARADLSRIKPLSERGVLSRKDYDNAVAAFDAAEANVQQAQAGREVARQELRAAEVSRDELEAARQAAQATLNLAQIDMDNTVIQAPEAGQLGQVGTRLGQYVTAGTQLVSLVPPTRWVIANFKERQAGKMHAGQMATVTVDALGDQRFTGRVRNLSPATGSEFTLMPAQNATGNFTKVAQRLPVEIVLNPEQNGIDLLRPGMSVVALINTSPANERSEE